ncbi:MULTISPECIES: hypothetical protein [unclassified Bradyrhizobium]|nr:MULTISPECIES: hypothetical protein [unclassified Bradyrhizobium]
MTDRTGFGGGHFFAAIKPHAASPASPEEGSLPHAGQFEEGGIAEPPLT